MMHQILKLCIIGLVQPFCDYVLDNWGGLSYHFFPGLLIILLVVVVSCETDGEKAGNGQKSENSEKAEMPYVRELTNEWADDTLAYVTTLLDRFTGYYHEIAPMIIMVSVFVLEL